MLELIHAGDCISNCSGMSIKVCVLSVYVYSYLFIIIIVLSDMLRIRSYCFSGFYWINTMFMFIHLPINLNKCSLFSLFHSFYLSLPSLCLSIYWDSQFMVAVMRCQYDKLMEIVDRTSFIHSWKAYERVRKCQPPRFPPKTGHQQSRIGTNNNNIIFIAEPFGNS